MSYRTLALILALTPGRLAWADTSTQDHLPTQRPALPDHKFIRGAFHDQFPPDQLATYGKKPDLARLTKDMSPEQRQGAKTALAALQATASSPGELAQIAEGYLLLKSADDASRIAAGMQAADPADYRGFSIGASAAFEQSDYGAATLQAEEALRLNPDDRRAFVTLALSKGRARVSGPAPAVIDMPPDTVLRGRVPRGEEAGPVSDHSTRRTLPFKPVIRPRERRTTATMTPQVPESDPRRENGSAPEGAVPLTAASLALVFGGLLWRSKSQELEEGLRKQAVQTVGVGAIVVGTIAAAYGGYLIYGAFTAGPAMALTGGGALAPAVAVEGAALAEGTAVAAGSLKLATDGYNYAKSQGQAQSGGQAKRQPSVDDLSREGQKPDRNGLTKAGRSLQKHGDRSGSAFPKIRWQDLNAKGQAILDEILTDPRARFDYRKNGILEVRAPSGRGAAYNSDGSFRGFLDPRL